MGKRRMPTHLSLAEKVTIGKRARMGENQEGLMAEFSICRATMHSINLNYEHLLKLYKESLPEAASVREETIESIAAAVAEDNLNEKRYADTVLPPDPLIIAQALDANARMKVDPTPQRPAITTISELDQLVSQWLREQRNKGMVISNSLLIMKAQYLHKSLRCTQPFPANHEWLTNFKYEHGISSKDVRDLLGSDGVLINKMRWTKRSHFIFSDDCSPQHIMMEEDAIAVVGNDFSENSMDLSEVGVEDENLISKALVGDNDANAEDEVEEILNEFDIESARVHISDESESDDSDGLLREAISQHEEEDSSEYVRKVKLEAVEVDVSEKHIPSPRAQSEEDSEVVEIDVGPQQALDAADLLIEYLECERVIQVSDINAIQRLREKIYRVLKKDIRKDYFESI